MEEKIEQLNREKIQAIEQRKQLVEQNQTVREDLESRLREYKEQIEKLQQQSPEIINEYIGSVQDKTKDYETL